MAANLQAALDQIQTAVTAISGSEVAKWFDDPPEDLGTAFNGVVYCRRGRSEGQSKGFRRAFYDIEVGLALPGGVRDTPRHYAKIVPYADSVCNKLEDYFMDGNFTTFDHYDHIEWEIATRNWAGKPFFGLWLTLRNVGGYVEVT